MQGIDLEKVKPYKRDAICDKCGYKNAISIFKPSRNLIERTCCGCKFEWYELPKVPKPRVYRNKRFKLPYVALLWIKVFRLKV